MYPDAGRLVQLVVVSTIGTRSAGQRAGQSAGRAWPASQGMGLPMALFILLILSMVGLAVQRITSTTAQQYSQTVSAARAYLAAYSGAQLVLPDALSASPCQCTLARQKIEFGVSGLSGCQVTVGCSRFVVDTDTYCTLTSQSLCDGSNASRTLEVRVK